MPPTLSDSEQEIENKLGDMADAKAEAAAARQLAFEGFDVWGCVTKFKGTVELPTDRLDPYQLVEIRLKARVVEIRHKDDAGSLNRIQILHPEPDTVEIISP